MPPSPPSGRTGRRLEALRAYETAVALKPADYKSRNHIGLVLEELFRWQESVAWFESSRGRRDLHRLSAHPPVLYMQHMQPPPGPAAKRCGRACVYICMLFTISETVQT